MRAWAAVVAIVLLGAGCTGGGADAPDGGRPFTDLLAGHDWSGLAGARAGREGVRISALDRRIVRQDGTGGQPNPPVALTGPRLRTEGDFTVRATLEGVGRARSELRLYSAVPIVYDEWREEPASLGIGVARGRLRVALWDGTSDRPAAVKAYGDGLRGTVRVEVRSLGDTFRFLVDGEEVGTLADPGVFGGDVWFGADAEVGGGWTLGALGARGESGDALAVEDPAPMRQPEVGDSLRKRAARLARPVGMGTAVGAQQLFADARYRAVLAGQYSVLTPENDFKPQFVQPREGVFAFAEGDALADFAKANGMRVHAHTLVWHEALPAWMRDDDDPAVVRRRMLDHVGTVAGHFRGRVAEWDVVNEPLSDDDADYTDGNRGLRSRQNPWFQAMGEEYIDLAFRRAHRADPGARLYLNEYGAEEDGPRWDALFALVGRLKARGVPIDGVGFQNHEYEEGDRVDPETFRAHVRMLAGIGVRARVSEMDVLVDADEHGVQAAEFAGKLRVCVEEPTCTGFGTWGFTDAYGSTADIRHYPPAPGDALPFDTRLKPKAAYRRMLETLR